MISRRTSNVPKDDVFPRLLYSDSMCFQACRWRSQVLQGLLSALPGLSSALPDLSSALPDMSSALPGLLPALPHLSPALADFSPALPDLLPTLPGAPRCTQSSLQCSEVFSNISQSLPWQSCTSQQRSQLLRKPARMPSYGLILSWNWRV